MKRNLSVCLCILILAFSLYGPARADTDSTNLSAPTIVSYQGQVIVSGVPYNGTGHFKFAIVNAAGTTSYWSNDGTSTIGNMPVAAVQLAVSGGLFNVLLGNTGQTALPASAFSATDRYLRVWFGTDTSTFTQLSPDRAIASVPFALRSQESANAATLNNQAPAYYLNASNLNAGTLSTDRYSAYADLTAEGYLDNSAPGDLLTQSQGDGRYLQPGQAANSRFLGLATASTVDTGVGVGEYTSITTGTDGLGLISYFDTIVTTEDLKVFHCANTACSSGTVTSVDTVGDVGRYSSITIGADGLGLISYFDFTNGDLKVFHCANVACTGGAAYTLDSAGVVGYDTSITIGADGLGLISYYDQSSTHLKVYHCANTACSSGNAFGIDLASQVGVNTSITLGSDGYGLISYYDFGNGDLKVFHCTNTACSSGASYSVDTVGNVGQMTSITVGADGLGLISYYDYANQDLKVFHCANLACSSGSATSLDTAGIVGSFSSITIGTDGLGLISYYDGTNGDLKLFHCANAACSGGEAYALDTAGDVGQFNSISIGADGFGLVSYFDYTNGHLKVAKLLGARRR